MKTAPVALFIYKRPDFTRRVLAQVNQAAPLRLYVIADGPKSPLEEEMVRVTRKCVEEFDWKCEVHHLYANQNLGLRERVMSGLDQVFSIEEEAIILEDDCLPSKSFFQFVSSGLEAYRQREDVSLVSGSSPHAPEACPDLYFTLESPIWGWATWSKSWRAFRSESHGRHFGQDEIKEISSTVEGLFAKRRMANFLRKSQDLDSWAIEFSAYNRRKGRLAVVSGVNLVENIGFGKGSTHTKFESFVDQSPALELEGIPEFPEAIRRDVDVEQIIARNRAAIWLTYPLKHPVDAVLRFLRYFWLILTGETLGKLRQ